MSSAVRFAGITKRYAGITALDDVSFEIAAGSCHAICGENGAGKSTLGKILAGIVPPDGGTIELAGVAHAFGSPRDALAAGVAMVHQELAFCDNLTVGENLCLGKLPRHGFFVDDAATRARAASLLSAVGATIDPSRAMHSLSVAEQQVVQIAGAVAEGARVIIFDEPTSSLGDAESEKLYALIGELTARGVTVLYVSHRMPEIFRLCDAVTVLRDGRHVITCARDTIDEATLVQHMIGRRVDQYFATHATKARGAPMLEIRSLGSSGRFADVTFSVHAGEVVGLAGLVGAGRSEIATAIFGLDGDASGDVRVRGDPMPLHSPVDAMRRGIGFVPEDRKRQGLVLGMRARENATLPTLPRFAHAGWIDRDAERAACGAAFDRLSMRASPDIETGALSGGNQQKIVLAKWLAANCDIL
ncbi:MAG TPA: sugar ABC transporter ATP-binding protein, partial [Gemmatimonadaceae bacterium]|nr:sugar ABC transporter ATP-binding protein [Gemmatimonadaceae bacterium]